MTNDGSQPTPSAGAANPPPTFAWQPITPRGVAAFARASLGRLLLVELLVASLCAGSVAWFLSTAWFPAVRQAIRQLPEQGSIHNQKLDSPLAFAETLAENWPFLIVVLDLEKQRNASQTSDVLVEFHRDNFQVCSLFGCVLFNYPKGWKMEFNHSSLASEWEAWEPILLGLVSLFVLVGLLASWASLATFYCGVVRLLGFFKDRDLTWSSSWRLASAAQMPGALLLAAGIICYGVGMVDLIRLLLLGVLHLVVGWVYLAFSPFFVPRLPDVAAPGENPFASGPVEQKPRE